MKPPHTLHLELCPDCRAAHFCCPGCGLPSFVELEPGTPLPADRGLEQCPACGTAARLIVVGWEGLPVGEAPATADAIQRLERIYSASKSAASGICSRAGIDSEDQYDYQRKPLRIWKKLYGILSDEHPSKVARAYARLYGSLPKKRYGQCIYSQQEISALEDYLNE